MDAATNFPFGISEFQMYLGEWAIALHGKGTHPFMKVVAEAVYSKTS
jgi:hypothetical protein